MAPFGKTIVDRISRDDKKMGDAWIRRIAPPHYEWSAHQALIDKVSDFSGKARHSFGHRLDGRQRIDRFPEALKKLGDWETDDMPDFHKWNNNDLDEGVLRLHSLDQDRVGAILCIARNGADGDPYITVVGGPVITPVDLQEIRNHGAPNWSKTFPSAVTKQYVPSTTDTTHAVAASMASFSRAVVPDTLQDLEAMIKPVIMTPGTQFCRRLSPTTTGGKSSSFRTLFLPMYCDPAVGIHFPTTIGYDDFCEFVAGQRPYKAFTKLLEEYSDVFRAWFEAAAKMPRLMAVNMQSAEVLWQALPRAGADYRTLCPTASTDDVALFLLQRMRLLWRYYCDVVLCGASRGETDEAARRDFLFYIQAANKQLGQVDLGWTNLPATDFPYLHLIFSMKGNAVIDAWLCPFGNESKDDLRVPPFLHKFPTIDLPAADDLSGAVGKQDAESVVEVAQPSPKRSRFKTPVLMPRAPSPSTSPPSRKQPRPSASSDVSDSESDDGDAAHWNTSPPPAKRRRGTHERSSRYGDSIRVDPRSQRCVTDERPRQHRVSSPGRGSHHEQHDLRRSPRNHSSARRGAFASSPEPNPGRRFGSTKRSLHYESDTISTPPRKRQRAASSSRSAVRFHQDQSRSSRSSRRRDRSESPQYPSRPLRGSFLRQGSHRGSDSDDSEYAPRRKTPKYDSMERASVASADECSRCPPAFIHMCLFMLQEVPRGRRLFDVDGEVHAPGTYASVEEPTSYARKNILAIFDHGSVMDPSSFQKFLAHRCTDGEEFPDNGDRMLPMDFQGLTLDLVKRVFDVNQWQMRSGTAMRDVPLFHILEFQRVLSPTLPKCHLPSEGYTQHFAQQFAKLVFSVFSAPGVVRSSRSRVLRDALFRQSEFGDILFRLCDIPFQHVLNPWWMDNQARLTNLWISDFIDLFEIVSSFVQYRTGTGMADVFDLMDIESKSGGPFVCASVQVGNRSGRRRQANYLDQLRRFRDEMAERWERGRYHGAESLFHQTLNPVLLDSKPKPAPTRSSSPRDRGTPDGDKKPKADEKAKPFTAVKPLFVYPKALPSGKLPQDMLRDSAEVSNWLKMKPFEKSDKGMRQLCFYCAFDVSKQCPDVKKCIQKRFRSYKQKGRGKQRMHIDLNDKKWKDYPVNNWKPLIEFQQEWSEWIQPSAELKELLPDASWTTSE